MPIVCLSQTELNSFKYFAVYDSPDKNGADLVIEEELINLFSESGYKLYNPKNLKISKEVAADPCILGRVSYAYIFDDVNGISLSIGFFDCLDNEVYSSKGTQFWARPTAYYFKKAVVKAFRPIYAHYHFFDLTKRFKPYYPEVEMSNETRESLTDYYDSNRIKPLEGIYKMMNGEYTIGIKKVDNEYKGIIIESQYQHWKNGEVKVIFNQTATPNIYSFKYYLKDKTDINSFLLIEENAFIEIPISDESKVTFIKTYPINIETDNINSNPNGWLGNGSGIIISKSGYIVTNYHVIKNTEEIEVEFIVNGELEKFNAEIIQTDKINDLAIIKIVDINFDGVPNIPFNFKTRSSDVGTKVYAFGYPMALTVMGKEIKVTDGIISSKTGFDGNITTYQITAPIQGGNSGGPLFDDKGNFIGINSSGLGADVAENVSYSIKTSYVLNLIDILPQNIDLPSSTRLQSLPLTNQIKEISKYVVLIKVK